MGQVDQRVTVVTGGSRGIGAAICLRLAAEGHDMAVGYRSDAEAAEGVAERVRALGGRLWQSRSTPPTRQRWTVCSILLPSTWGRSPGW